MKNLLSENMMRFGTKNLTEAAKKELTLKSILETIDQYGLRTEVRKALAEAAIPEGAKVNVDSPSKGNITVPVPTDSATVGAARKIIGTIMKQTSGIDNNKAIQQAVYSIKSPAIYYVCLYLVAKSQNVKSHYGFNFSTVGNMLGQDMTFAAGQRGQGHIGTTVDVDSPGAMISKLTGYEGMYRDIERHLQQFNKDEYIPTESID
jgi:hypothetical protein